MKKILALILCFALLSISAFAAEFTIEESESAKFVVTERAMFAKTEPVTFNDQSTQFWEYTYDNWPNSTFNWVKGKSGEEGDYAASLEMKTNKATTQTGEKQDRMYLLYCILNDAATKLDSGGGVLTLDFDIKLNTNCDTFSIDNMPLWTSKGGGEEDMILFGSDGKIPGTDFEYPAGEWMHLTMKANFDESWWNVWVDGEQILTNKPFAGGYYANRDRVRVFLKQITEKAEGETPAGFAIDNFAIYAEGKDISNYMTLSAEDKDGKLYETTATHTEPVLKLAIEGVKNKAMVNSENIVLVNSYGGEIPYEGEYKSSVYTMIPSEKLESEQDYYIKISDKIRTAINMARPPSGKIKFTTGNWSDVVIESASYKTAPQAGGKAEITLKLKNNKEEAYTVGMVAVLYNSQNGAVAISRVNSELIAGSNDPQSLFLNIPADFSAQGCKTTLYITAGDSFAEIDSITLN